MRDINVDVVMCIDGSAGMNPIIDEFKANASSLFNKVIDKIEETGTYISSFRIKVIVFRDYGCDVEPWSNLNSIRFPIKTIISGIL